MTLADALTRRGVRFRQVGQKVSLNCPFCPGRGKPADTRMRLAVHAKDGWGRCLYCDWSRKSSAATSVLRQLGIPGEVTGGGRPSPEPEREPVALPGDFALLSDAADPLDLMARDYVLGRGVTEGQMAARGVGVSYTRPWQYRVVFPVVAEGELRCINGRVFTGRGKPKYLLSAGDKWLAYLDPGADACVLSEGVIKALRIEQVLAAGSCSAALLGHDLTDVQLGQVQRSACASVTLWPDADLVGRRGFIKIADKLSENWGGAVSMVWPPPGPADDVPLGAIRRALASATPYTARVRHRMLLVK